MPSLFGMQLGREELERATGRLDQVGGITPFELTDGRARGLAALRINTGAGLEVVALAGRNLDLAHAFYRDIPLCWRSCNGDALPTYYEPEGNQWLRTFFGGLLTTCGLTNFGPGGTDAYGKFGLHGRINCLPAEDVGWSERWDGDECVLEVWGTTRETKLFSENLSLQRRLRTALGGTSLWLEDTVTNHGYEPAPHMILYHCNGGFPLLWEGSRFAVTQSAMRPRDSEAERGLSVWNQVTRPQHGFKEQVFIHTPIACSDGRAAVVLANDRLQCGAGLGLALRFDPRRLPALIQWRMLDEGTYVMGMEPANCPTIEGRIEAERQGTLPFLQPGESRRYEIEFRVLTSRAEVDELVAEVDRTNAAVAE